MICLKFVDHIKPYLQIYSSCASGERRLTLTCFYVVPLLGGFGPIWLVFLDDLCYPPIWKLFYVFLFMEKGSKRIRDLFGKGLYTKL